MILCIWHWASLIYIFSHVFLHTGIWRKPNSEDNHSVTYLQLTVMWTLKEANRDTCANFWASQLTLVVKNPFANAGDVRDKGSIPAWGRSPGGEHGNPLQYSCLESIGLQRVRHDRSHLARMHTWKKGDFGSKTKADYPWRASVRGRYQLSALSAADQQVTSGREMGAVRPHWHHHCLVTDIFLEWKVYISAD